VRGTCRRISTIFVAAVLGVAPWRSGAAQTAASGATPPHDLPSRDPSHTIAQRVRVLGIPNFGEVTPTLFRGAQPSHKGFESLSKMGIAIVVDLRGGGEANREQQEVAALGMRFVDIPWRCLSPADRDFAKFLALLHDNAHKKIFVHCHMGVDRTGMMIASYRMAEQGWTAEEALREMHAFGFNSFHQLTCTGLGSYEQRFPSIVSSSPAFEIFRDAQEKLAASPIPPKQ
jgi:protein tyrosine phosphatase (PTP) superfamily phosphohydrolase (DUF442 family)